MSWVSSLLQALAALLPRRLHNTLAALPPLFRPFERIPRLIQFTGTQTPKSTSRNQNKSSTSNLNTDPDLGEQQLDLDYIIEENEATANLTTASSRKRARKQLRKRTAKQKKDQSPTMAPTEKGKGKGKAPAFEQQSEGWQTGILPEITNQIQRVKLEDVPGVTVGKPRTAIWVEENATTEGAVEVEEEPYDPVLEAEKAQHREFMAEALDMARLALKTNETPVGCILVHNGRMIAKGMNATNITRNGSRHAELMALTALLSHPHQGDIEDTREHTDEEWGDVDPKDGHIYPYGQKLHPSPRITPDIIKECVLYVTVEPCVMCASLLRQLRIKKVYFGAINDKFGGTGGVFRINKNSSPAPLRTPTCWLKEKTRSKIPTKGQYDEQKMNSTIIIAEGTIPDAHADGDGGNVEHGYPVEGGWGRDDAVNLLRQFYVQENGRAPVPRKKEGRAARLAAMMERAGQTTEGVIVPLGENDLSSTEPSIASGASTPSLLAGPMLAAAIPDGPPEKGPAPAMSGAAPTVASTMAAKPTVVPGPAPARGAASTVVSTMAAKPTNLPGPAPAMRGAVPTAASKMTAKPAIVPAVPKIKLAVPKIVPAVPILGNAANRPATKTANGGAPKS